MAEATDYTFFATDYDPEKGRRACRRLADAFARGRDPRSEDIREAMAAATAAFPGLGLRHPDKWGLISGLEGNRSPRYV